MTIRYPRPPVSPVWQAPDGSGPDFFVGGMAAAADTGLLGRHRIGTVLNCSINADIDYVETPYDSDAPAGLRAYGYAPVRYHKIGLVDGPGNPPEMMLAAWYLLRGIVAQQMPERPSYPNAERGNVLVHCRAGRSRSIAVMALYLHLSHGDRFPELADALAHVRQARLIRPEEFHEAPNRDLVAAAEWAAAVVQPRP